MLKLDFLGRYDVADMLMVAASFVVIATILIAIWDCHAAPWREEAQDVRERIVTRAEIEVRHVIARHLFDALSAKYPDKYVTLVLPRDAADDASDLSVPKSEG
jgi:hypothetical protein